MSYSFQLRQIPHDHGNDQPSIFVNRERFEFLRYIEPATPNAIKYERTTKSGSPKLCRKSFAGLNGGHHFFLCGAALNEPIARMRVEANIHCATPSCI